MRNYKELKRRSSTFEDCQDRLNELDRANQDISNSTHSDGQGFIPKDLLETLKGNNKEMYSLRKQIQDIQSCAIKIQSIARGYNVRKNKFSEKESEKSSSMSSFEQVR